MKPILDANKAMRDSMEAYSSMRNFISSPCYTATIEWIEGLITQTQASMLSCAKEKLPDAQVRLKQLISMRSALVDPGGATTGYTFD